MLSICQRGGLANRLWTIVSYGSAERRQGRGTVVFWPDSRDFPGTFEESFMPVPGIITLPMHPPYDHADLKEPSLKDCRHNAQADWSMLRELQPTYEVRQLLPTGVYDAVHIRKTDLDELIRRNGWTPQHALEDYDKFIEESDADFVWLATDNPATQHRMMQKHNGKVRCLCVMQDTDAYTYHDGRVRYTSGMWTVADMFACVSSRRFMGSKHSSLTSLIKAMRNPEEVTRWY